jgi:SEFIR domain
MEPTDTTVNELEKGAPRPRVFISYSHDNEAHRENVLALSERLRKDGIETIIDQYVNGVPKQGWPRWMLDQLDAADYVLVVCTETYYRRFRGHEKPGKGKGVDWEGALITLEIYNSRSQTLKFVPVFLSNAKYDWIPEPLRAWNYYDLTSEDAYKELYEFLLEQAGVEPGELGSLKRKKRRRGAAMTFLRNAVPTSLRSWVAAAVLILLAVVGVGMLMLDRAPTLTVLPGPYETMVPSKQEQLDDPENQWSLELQVAGKKPQIVKPYWGQPLQIGQGSNGLAISTGDEIRIKLRSSIANECVEWVCKVEKQEDSQKPQEFTLEEQPFAPCQ